MVVSSSFGPLFVTLRTMVPNKTVDNGAKLTRLIRYCVGKTNKMVKCCAAKEATAGYENAIKLEERFSNEFSITEAWISKFIDGGSIV
jgi:hypothetical protein